MINKIKKLYLKYEELILYLFFGGLTTIISVGLFAILGVFFDVQNNAFINGVCVIFKNIIAITFAYITNRIFVFKSKNTGFKAISLEVISFFGARMATLVFEVVFMNITTIILHQNALIMNIIAQFVIVVLNYVFSKLWIFKKNKK